MSDAAIILGKVEAVRPRKGIPAATLLPIAEVTPDGARWSTPYDEPARRTHFPNAGRISWIEPPDHAVPGTYWVFRTEYQPTYEKDPSDPHRDKYRVDGRSWYEPATEVLDLDALGGEPLGRERLTRAGVSIEAAEKPARYLKWGTLITPKPLPFTKVENGLWVVDPAECKQSMDWRELQDPDCVLACPDGSRKHFLLPEFVPPGTRVVRDWGSDEDVLMHVLKRLKKWDPDFSTALDLTDKAIVRLVSILPTSATDADNLEFHRHRVERVKQILERAKSEQELVEHARSVLAHGPLLDAVEKEKAAVRLEVRCEAEKAVEAELGAKREQLARLDDDANQKKAELEELERQLEERRRDLQNRVEEFEVEMESRVRKAVDTPGSLLADIAIARVFGRVLSETQASREPKAGGPLLPGRSGTEVTDERAALTALEKSFVVHEVPLSALRPLHASFLAGVVPLVAGSRAYEALAAYAQVVCAGYAHWVTVSPGCLEPLDLFGRIDPNSGRFIPGQGDLARVLAHARTQDCMHLVVLDGITRAGVDSCLLPLLDCAFDAMRGVESRELRLLPPNTKTLSGADPELDSFRWPSNVLLAGIVRQGGSSFAPPAELWTRATFLMPDLCAQSVSRPESIHPDVWATQRRSLPTTRVPASAWAEWQRTRQTVTLNHHTQFWSAPNAPKVDRGLRETFLRVFAASSGNTELSNAALHDAVSMTLLPALRTNPDAVNGLWDAAGCLYPDARAACEKAVDWLG